MCDKAPLPQQSAKQSRQRVQKPTIVSAFSLLLTKTTDMQYMRSKNVKYKCKELIECSTLPTAWHEKSGLTH